MTNRAKKERRPYLTHGIRQAIAKALHLSLSAVDARIRRGDPEAINLATRFQRELLNDRRNARILRDELFAKKPRGGHDATKS